jgi:cellulose synthase/poly-beta-1,6-N-acetylglucosamine synthase-like glycosyltransferase
VEKFLMRIGERLYRRGAITQAQLDTAVLLQQKTGSRFGDVLIGEGSANYRALYEAIAESKNLPFIDLQATPPDPSLLSSKYIGAYLRLRLIPWRKENGPMTIAVCDTNGETLAWIKENVGENTDLAMTSPLDIRRTVENVFRAQLEKRSQLWLWSRKPHASARVTLLPRQKQICIMLAVALLIAAAVAPIYSALAFIIFCHVAYTATMIFKCGVFVAGVSSNVSRQTAAVPEIPDQSLPVYTILIPMYKEAKSVPGMLIALSKLDYPASKLDIKLVLESDDKETYAAAMTQKLGYHFDIIRVPPSQPRTKPKACNYAIRFARGEFVTIFDADDRPEPGQLKKAVRAFRTLPADVACLQARLNYYNANDNLLTRFFSLEYTILFHFILYGLERLGIPLPLGGTSNHIALARLKELGEWDPYNVTEDADLGIRLAAQGFKTRMLDSYTMEEAPVRVRPWTRQRTRWIKGYMQTWLVHMRDPVGLYHQLGLRGFLGFQCFIGLSCFSFLTAPLVWGFSFLWIDALTFQHQIAFPEWLMWLTLGNLGLNLLTHWYLSFYCATLYRRHTLSMLLAAFLYPLYLILHSWASWRAIAHLVLMPHVWEKTAHGITRQIDQFFERDILKMGVKSR